MLTREDRVVLVQRSDGSQAVEHGDGTRISSWFQDRPAKVAASGDPPVQEDAGGSQLSLRWCFVCVLADAEETTPTSTPPTSTPPTSGREEAAPGPTHDGKAQRDRERVVSVEKEGCATVVMFPERRAAQVHLADGTVVTATNQGTYEASPAPPSPGQSRQQQVRYSRLSAPSGASVERRQPEDRRRRDVHVRAREAQASRRRCTRLQDESHGQGGL